MEVPGPTTVKARVPQQFYVVSNVQQSFLSKQCLVELGIISEDFPKAGEAWIRHGEIAGNSAEAACNYDGAGSCNCPVRELPPSQPAALPCDPTVENIPKLEEYIRERYKASAFNNCWRQKIPTLKGSPPLTLNVSREIQPKACHKPAAVPLHW